MVNEPSRVRRAGAVLLALLLMSGTAFAAGDDAGAARAWVERMAKAVQTLNYDGTFIYQQGAQIDAVRIVHAAGPKGERERLLTLNGPAREIIRDGAVLTSYLPDRKAVRMEKRRPHKPYPPRLPTGADQIAGHYEFVLSGQERVAGYDTRIVTLKPRDAWRYGQRLWLDTATAMPLKSELLDEHGEAIEQMMFTGIRFLPQVPDELLRPTLGGPARTWRHDEAAAETMVESRDWQVTDAPDGFMLTHHTRHPLRGSKSPAEHLMYSDGLASLSIYIEQTDEGRKMLNGMSRMGAVNAWGSVVNGHHVTVMGEVPAATVRRVGESLRYQPEKSSP